MSRKFRVKDDTGLLRFIGVHDGDVAEYVKDATGAMGSPGYYLRGPKRWSSTIHGDNVLWLHKDLVVEIKEDVAKPAATLQDEFNECVEAVIFRRDGSKINRMFEIAESGDQTLSHITVDDALWLRFPQPMRVALLSSMAFVVKQEIR